MDTKLAKWVEGKIKEFTSSKANSMEMVAYEPAWDEPFIGVSSGADPLYTFYKSHIGDFHLTPVEYLSEKYPNDEFIAEEVSVISWVLPQTKATKKDNRAEKFLPSERWARSRIYGGQFNNTLRKHLEEVLEAEGVKAVSPMLSPLWKFIKSENHGLASTWSERHAAYAAGLGTFSLSDGLITKAGKAHRLGSIIVAKALEPTQRLYEEHTDHCLFYQNGSCGKCIERCPIGAISEKGHDKALCQKYVDMTWQYVERAHHFKGYGCGLCQTGVPCESRIPKRAKKTS
ncbi:MAG: 4Fe-4S ferredoxin [Deltaproteobacteria bacterium]|nr:MAG: 4Fe-4S ferredoxin [Deltaproteobacteria bacterium]